MGAVQRALIADILGPGVTSREDFPLLCESLLVLHRGLALTGVLRENPAFDDEMLRLWAERFLKG
ncbi:hypothetical protein [Streptacidiphilus sp. MAP5-3]|uniref:hypothetical protein n=1 Tax=unclassified Streptacidiphilus TaxID=2643834 RepID=UPI003516E98E